MIFELRDKVIIFGDQRDPHVITVRDALRSCGRVPYVFSRYDTRCHLSLNINEGNPTLTFFITGATVQSNEISSVWWRQKPFGLFYPDKPERNFIQEFIGREWHQLLNGFAHFLPDAKWINSIEAQIRANSKPLQLVWAKQAGFMVPKTVFTNHVDDVSDLVSNGSSVYKTFSGYIFPESSAIFTSPITSENITAASQLSIGLAPGIYQNYVDKKHELRIYFIDDTIFSIKIDSQSNTETKFDWRENQSLPINSLIETPTVWAEKIKRYKQLSGLAFGAIDAVVTPTDELFFLECNPAGQWLWLEEATGAPISKAVANALACIDS